MKVTTAEQMRALDEAAINRFGIPGIVLGHAAATGGFEVEFGEFSPLSYVAIWSTAISALLAVSSRRTPRRTGRPLRRTRSHP